MHTPHHTYTHTHYIILYICIYRCNTWYVPFRHHATASPPAVTRFRPFNLVPDTGHLHRRAIATASYSLSDKSPMSQCVPILYIMCIPMYIIILLSRSRTECAENVFRHSQPLCDNNIIFPSLHGRLVRTCAEKDFRVWRYNATFTRYTIYYNIIIIWS